MKNYPHLTAIKRNKLSAPIARLINNTVLRGNILDYGCGHGDDVRFLSGLGVKIKGYDPYWNNNDEVLRSKYDTILCTYVLNVIGPKKRRETIKKITKLCNDDAVIYLTVRRDIKIKEKTTKNTTQYPVELNLDIENETSHYCTYRMRVKRCIRCGCAKNIEEFRIGAGGEKTKTCDKCLKLKADRAPAYNLTLKRRYWYYKKDAKRANRSFDISLSDFDAITLRQCAYCGGQSTNNVGICGIDRIDPNSGYEINNCVPCCDVCNFMKRTMTKEEFLNKIKQIYNHSVINE